VLGVDYLELMRLAGYVVPESSGATSGMLAQALSSQDLTQDEARALLLESVEEEMRDSHEPEGP